MILTKGSRWWWLSVVIAVIASAMGWAIIITTIIPLYLHIIVYIPTPRLPPSPPRERAESRSLRRAVSKEQRGVMRSLRKDAAFMHAVRERERAARDVERVAGQRRALAALEQQEADARSGGQGGGGKKRKRGGKG